MNVKMRYPREGATIRGLVRLLDLAMFKGWGVVAADGQGSVCLVSAVCACRMSLRGWVQRDQDFCLRLLGCRL